MDQQKINKVAGLLNDALSRTLADMMVGIAKRHNLSADEVAVAITIALATNAAATAIAAAAPLPLGKASELAAEIQNCIGNWLAAQQEAV